jgi:hypothetical protein
MLTLTFQVDAVLLEAMRGPAEVGFYGRRPWSGGLTLVPRVIGYALIPTMAALRTAPGVVTELYQRGSASAAGWPPVAVLGARESDRRSRSSSECLPAERRSLDGPARNGIHVPAQLRRDDPGLHRPLGYDRPGFHGSPASMSA